MRFQRQDSGEYVAPGLEALAWLEHGFGSRVSNPPEERIATVKQIHSDIVHLVAVPNACVGEGDGLISNKPGVRLVVRTADCVPVLLADAKQKAVAAIHAGWRGSAAEIVPRAVQKMVASFGTEPGDLVAAIGPSIGACCYEVGSDVARHFTSWVPHLRETTQQACVDLPEVNRLQLLAAGVSAQNIHMASLCTKCRQAEFFSFRREQKQAGRMHSWIGIRSNSVWV